MAIKVITTPEEFKNWRKYQDNDVGFVPTMGALHTGHEELLRQSRKENKISVLSIFVNPTQFNNSDDFENYPLTWDEDIKVAERNQVDIIFAPQSNLMYQDQYRYQLTENDLSQKLCGQHRPGHFAGVLTVVMKLFNIVRPKNAYFGEKDFQQLELIRGMVDAYFMDINIVPVKTIREASGLAKSSRNLRLSENEKELASQLFKSLKQFDSKQDVFEHLSRLGIQVEYIEDIKNRRFIAAQVGKVRLIDNIEK